MRKYLFNKIHNIMKNNRNIYVLTADLGYYLLDDIKKDYPNNFYNLGSSEQLLIGTGTGLALSNKIPICYSITPFLLCRPFETIRIYLNNEKIPVKMIGSGRGKDYLKDGFTHWSDDDEKIINIFNNIEVFKPSTTKEIDEKLEYYLFNENPVFISVSK